MSQLPINALFCDLGGVLLTNGWDHSARHRAVLQFELEEDEFNSRHQVYFPLYEQGIFTLEEYLNGVVFYRRRSFSRSEFTDFIYAQSHLDITMLAILRRLKLCRPMTFVALSNEGAEIARYRAQKFHLLKLFDIYLISAFVHLRKPDPAFYRLALDLVQLPPQQVLYLEDRQPFVEVAANLGIDAYHHQNAIDTANYLEQHLDLVKGSLQLPD